MSKKILLKYTIFGTVTGLFVSLISFVSLRYNTVEILGNILVYIPFKIYEFIYQILHICPYDLKSECGWFGLDLVIFTAPIYWGLLGFLIGLLVGKLRKKK